MKLRALLLALAISGLVIISDQLSKNWAERAYQNGSRQIIGSIVELTAVANRGVAFGRLSGAGLIVIMLIALALAALLYYFFRHLDKPLVWLPVGLIIGGAVGNIIDRLDQGYVYDFIAIGPWPAFNLADSAIVIGVITLFVIVEIQGRRNQQSHNDLRKK